MFDNITRANVVMMPIEPQEAEFIGQIEMQKIFFDLKCLL